MSKVSHLPKAIPSKELPFTLKCKGSVTGFNYEGEFVIKVPSVRDSSSIGVELAKLNKGVPHESLDRSTASLNNAIAYLRVCLIKAPAWFINEASDEDEEGMDYGLDTMDVNVPIAIFKQADKLTGGWYKSLKGQPSESQEKN